MTENTDKKYYLFFFVHPSKFYVFRSTINYLKEKGHHVDVLITSKDILEDLVISEGWDYTNIFPGGRKMKGINPLISSSINLLRTVFRLYKYCKGKKYDLFITDDLLVFLSRWFKTPCIVFTDDDLSVTKRFSIILAKATCILSPEVTDLGKYNSKKVGFNSYKELAYLHPDEFTPEIDRIKCFNPNLKPYFLIRLVHLKSYHDVGVSGLTNDKVLKLIDYLSTKGKVFIISERTLSKDLERFNLTIKPIEIAHALFFAEAFISDSQTMASEAAVLGTPSFRCNDFAGIINVMDEKENYNLLFSYSSNEFDSMIKKIKSMVFDEKNKIKFQKRRKNLLNDKINLSSFLKDFFMNYPLLPKK